MQILVIGNSTEARRWQPELLSRLEKRGHDIAFEQGAGKRSAGLDQILSAEKIRFGSGLATLAEALEPRPAKAAPELVIDLTGAAPKRGVPTLTIEFAGQVSLAAGVSAMLTGTTSEPLLARLDGVPVATARPMIGDRVWLSRAVSDLLAGAIGLIEMCVARFAAGRLTPIELTAPIVPQRDGGDLVWRYLPHLAGGLLRRAVRKLTRRPFYWQTAYRLNDGQGVADTGSITGTAFTVIPDDGQRFYADPFAFSWQGRDYVFVEEFPYATGRGVIAVAVLGADGRTDVPRVVLEEMHHLSYPQVFAHDGEVYMIPESSAAHELVLYRAARFPDRWVRQAVLVAGADLNDMTLIERGERFWLIGTERRCGGSASDTMVVYSSRMLEGPWLPHSLNPIRIDRSAARPGGRAIERDGKLFLPVQDGTLSYGGGLGLVEILELDDAEVRFGPLQPIREGTAWNRQGIHSLSRAGRLEVIDSAG